MKKDTLVLFREDVINSNEKCDHLQFSKENREKIRLANFVIFIENDGSTKLLKYRYGKIKSDLSFNELRKANRKMSEDSFPASKKWKTADWAMAITGELGELCNMFKKRSHGKEISQEDIEHEFADIQIYLEKWADREGIDLASATRKKFNIVAERVRSKAKL